MDEDIRVRWSRPHRGSWPPPGTATSSGATPQPGIPGDRGVWIRSARWGLEEVTGLRVGCIS